MFEKIFSWWKEDPLLKQALKQTAMSLEKVGDMFLFAMKAIFEEAPEEKKIYEMDKEVNDLQIDTRRKVLEHLSIKPKQDVTSSLILITVIIDIERIGDYSKNIVELHSHSFELKNTPYLTELQEMRKLLEKLIVEIRDVFVETNKEKAEVAMKEYTKINRKCEENFKLLANDESLTPKEALVYALLFRYIKRISSHLRNISSSVINPFHRLGYIPSD